MQGWLLGLCLALFVGLTACEETEDGTTPSADTTLPPLKLSMHVYAEDPVQRFVILDGRRLGEGAALAEGVFVQSIRRDGLVVSVRGQAYWLAR